jgi:hypothetical protein
MATAANPLASLAGPGGAGLATEPIQGNSLTQFIRSIEGLTGQQGQGILGQGLSTTNQGVTAVAPVLSYLTNLVQGNQADITQAAQPEIDQIQQQFDQIRNLISLQPRGGGKTTALAEAPFQEAGQIQRTEGQLRSNAATSLGNLGTQLAGVGLGEAGLGAGLEQQSSNIALTKEGQDYGQSTPIQTFNQFSQALSNLI